jgi:polar amino acid transport system substrate-binding protein
MKPTLALTLTALLALTVGAASPGTAMNDDHQTALAAVQDIEAARTEIIKIEDSQVVGHPSFVRAAQRALNAVVGRGDNEYKADAGDPGDGTGAIGNLDHLLDRRDDSLWTPAMQGAKANLLAVVVDLHDAMSEKQMEDYETDLTEALANLALASGRPSEDGVLGGLSGALANTSLGVPAGASTVSGCTLPSRGPVYGVVNGHLAYVALPRSSATPIPAEMSVSRVVVHGDAVVLYTRQTNQIAALCRQAHLDRTRDVKQSRHRARGARRRASHRIDRDRRHVRQSGIVHPHASSRRRVRVRRELRRLPRRQPARRRWAGSRGDRISHDGKK